LPSENFVVFKRKKGEKRERRKKDAALASKRKKGNGGGMFSTGVYRGMGKKKKTKKRAGDGKLKKSIMPGAREKNDDAR